MATLTTLPGMTFDAANYFYVFYLPGSPPSVWNVQAATQTVTDGVLTSVGLRYDFDADATVDPGDSSFAVGSVTAALNHVLPTPEWFEGTQTYSFDTVADLTFRNGAGQIVAVLRNAPVTVNVVAWGQDTDGDGVTDTYNYSALSTTMEWDALTGDDLVTFGDGNDRFLDTGGSLDADLGGGDDYIYAYGYDDDTGITYKADTIRGGAGNDTIDAQGLGDSLDGGSGNDAITSYGAGSATLRPTAYLTGGTGDDTVSAYDLDIVIIDGANSGSDTYNTYGERSTIDYTGAGALVVDLMSPLGQIITDTSTGDVDTLPNYQPGLKIIGTQHGDRFVAASNVPYSFVGAGGDDIFDMQVGGDTIDGGEGRDIASFAFASTEATWATVGGVTTVTTVNYLDFWGSPYVTTLTGVETLRFSDRDVTLVGAVNLVLTGGPDVWAAADGANYNVDGRGGHDRLTGGSGDDTLTGGAGNDTMAGGAGNDNFRIVTASPGTDAFDGGAGHDRIVVTQPGTVMRVSALTGVEAIDVSAGVATLLMGAAADVLDLSGTTVTGALTLNSGSGNDTVTGTAGQDYIIGAAGDDSLSGGDGSDAFEIGRGGGRDTIDGGFGYDTVYLTGTGAQLHLTALSNVEAVTGNFSSVIVGTAAGERLNLSALEVYGIGLFDGRQGDDTMIGSDFDDRIMGHTGADLLVGGYGYDQFVYTTTGQSRGATADTIADFVQGEDVIDLSAVDANRLLEGVQDFVLSGTAAVAGLAGQLWYDATSFADETRFYGDTNGDGRADMEIRLSGSYALGTGDILV